MRTGKIEIRAPLWGGGRPNIGIADFRIKGLDVIEAEIIYVRKTDGLRSYPGTYSMKVSEITQYPTQIVRGGVKLYVVPLEDWVHTS